MQILSSFFDFDNENIIIVEYEKDGLLMERKFKLEDLLDRMRQYPMPQIKDEMILKKAEDIVFDEHFYYFHNQ